MPNRRQHEEEGQAFGWIAGAVGNLVVQDARMKERPGTPFDVGEFVVWTGVGGLIGKAGSVSPDWAEPAWTPRHRATAHSWAALGSVAIGTVRFLQADVPGWARLLVGAFGVGYVSHLLSDAQTPIGLPLL